jgi:hypothetical protein
MLRRHMQEYAALLLFTVAKLLLFQLVAAADIPCSQAALTELLASLIKLDKQLN